jgi:hypothetical protein
MRFNPGLARYFSNTTVIEQNIVEVNKLIKESKLNEPYISIAEEKSLKLLPTFKYPLEK